MAAMGTTLGNGFQSTLPRGERPPSFPARSRCCRYFNPRSREGSDMPELRLTCGKKISIHAPARGATRSLFRIAKAGSYFNPRSREGSDVNPLPRRGASIRFQSTLPRGERRTLLGFSTTLQKFQSTLPRGERPKLVHPTLNTNRFQSTLPRGERRKVEHLHKIHFLFQSTLPRGERHDRLQRSLMDANISIHAPARGATSSGHRPSRNRSISIHAPARGATLSRTYRGSLPRIFQSTLPRGERR